MAAEPQRAEKERASPAGSPAEKRQEGGRPGRPEGWGKVGLKSLVGDLSKHTPEDQAIGSHCRFYPYTCKQGVVLM